MLESMLWSFLQFLTVVMILKLAFIRPYFSCFKAKYHFLKSDNFHDASFLSCINFQFCWFPLFLWDVTSGLPFIKWNYYKTTLHGFLIFYITRTNFVTWVLNQWLFKKYFPFYHMIYKERRHYYCNYICVCFMWPILPCKKLW